MQENKIKVAFLDRDGVINKEINYLHKIKDFQYTINAVKGIKKLIKLGYSIVIVTNQAGIARGIFTLEDYLSLTRWYLNDLKKNEVSILSVYFCPHHKNGVVKEYSHICNCRKPNPGMLFNAAREYNIDLSQSILIGDKISDAEAGVNAGLKKVYLVSTGHHIDDTCWDEPIYNSIYDVAKALS
jgi:D-glycero-D-manno-heptose 1,7-bisphosphate phosphatase